MTAVVGVQRAHDVGCFRWRSRVCSVELDFNDFGKIAPSSNVLGRDDRTGGRPCRLARTSRSNAFLGPQFQGGSVRVDPQPGFPPTAVGAHFIARAQERIMNMAIAADPNVAILESVFAHVAAHSCSSSNRTLHFIPRSFLRFPRSIVRRSLTFPLLRRPRTTIIQF